MLKCDPALCGSLAANLVAVQRNAILEHGALKRVAIQRFGDLVEQGPTRSQDRRVGVEQQLVEQPMLQKLRRERGASECDCAVRLVANGGELTDGVSATDDARVVVGGG